MTDAPIMVTGNPRSGTTWMQWFLSQHPRIHIHGQEPNLPWSEMWGWFRRLVEQGAWAAESRHYEIAHYAGSDEERCRRIFRRFYRDYMTGYGPETPRWGIKSLWFCVSRAMVSQFESLWPETRWVVCIRHPFASFESQRNTFVPDMDLDDWCKRWVATARFAQEHDPRRTVLFQIDRLSDGALEVRRRATDAVLACVGEARSPETDEFVTRWPRVHEVIPRQRRTFVMSRAEKEAAVERHPELAVYAERLGYEVL
ncbi:MAG: sulfotransferase [Planctomycetes bacterium]|nr:sulfotransferase [Planctomycetota bacterium]